MRSTVFVILFQLLAFLCVSQAQTCSEGSSTKSKKINFDLISKKNETGHWITDFEISNVTPKLSKTWKVHIEQNTDCSGGLERLHLKGTLTVPPPVPEGYTLHAGVGYYKKYSKSPGGFDEAMNTCARDNAHLAIVDSEMEFQVIKSMAGEGATYLGFHDREREGEFVTVLGEPLNSTGFTRWMPNEPNNGSGNEDCGTYHSSGGFNDVPCNLDYPFICEFDLSWAH